MKRKILCILENIGQGGAERQLIGLASMLAQEGNEVKIIIYDADFFYLPLLKSTGVECEYLSKAKNKLRRIPVIASFIKSFAPDVVVAFLSTPSVVACIAKIFIGGFKLIVSERNTNQSLTRSDKIRFYLYKYADIIVPNSYSQSDFIKEYYPCLGNKIYTITNFTDTDYFHPRDNNVISTESNILRIVCVGRIGEQKNVKLFIKAIRKCIDKKISLRVDWYGLAFPPYSDECKRMVVDRNMEDYFYFHKETSDVRAVYHNADVLMLPSVYEGFPNVVCEAMACGLPVLCSDVCDNGRIVRDGENGFLFDPRSEEAIVDAIEKFSGLSNEERLQMSKKSREYAESDFSGMTFFDRYKKIIYE